MNTRDSTTPKYEALVNAGLEMPYVAKEVQDLADAVEAIVADREMLSSVRDDLERLAKHWLSEHNKMRADLDTIIAVGDDMRNWSPYRHYEAWNKAAEAYRD